MKKVLVGLLFLISQVGGAFTLPSNYNTWDAEKKLEILWNQTKSTQYKTLPTKTSFTDLIRSLRYKIAAPAFHLYSDLKPKKDLKILHPFGSVAPVDFVITNPNTPYSGLFKTGGSGLLRLSLAIFDQKDIIPGLAIKILVDGMPSQNTHLMKGLDGQGTNMDLFKYEYSNIIPEPTKGTFRFAAIFFKRTIKKLKRKFPGQDQGGSAFRRPVNSWATVTRNGMMVPKEKVVAPYKITFMAPKNNRFKINPSDQRDFREVLGEMNHGTIMYEVFVSGEEEPVKIGHIILKEKFIASDFGDTLLNFQHTF